MPTARETCPEPKCRETLLTKINEDNKDLKSCISDKVSKRTITYIITTFVVIVIGVSGTLYTIYSRGQDKSDNIIFAQIRENKERSTDNEKRANKIEQQIELIKKDTEIIREKVKKTEEQSLEQVQNQMIIMRMLRELNDKKHGGKP